MPPFRSVKLAPQLGFQMASQVVPEDAEPEVENGMDARFGAAEVDWRCAAEHAQEQDKAASLQPPGEFERQDRDADFVPVEEDRGATSAALSRELPRGGAVPQDF